MSTPPTSFLPGDGAPREGFSLVEVTLALGIAAFCLVALFGLLPTGLSIVRKGVEEAAALDRAGALLADVRTTPVLDAQGQLAKYTLRYKLDMGVNAPPQNAADPLPEIFLDEQGNRSVAGAEASARYRVGYRLLPQPPQPSPAPSPALSTSYPQGARAYLRVTWPAAVPAAQAQGMVEISSTVDRQ